MPEFLPLFLDTGSIEVATGSRVIDFMHFPATASISSSFNTLLPDPYLFATMSGNITNAVSTTSSSLFQFVFPNRRNEQPFYIHNSIVGVTTSATTTGVRIGIQRDNNTDAIANIKVSSTLTAHTIACVGSQIGTTFALPASMAAINTVYPCFVKSLYNNSIRTSLVNNVILLQPETNNTVTAVSGSVSYNKFAGYSSSLSGTRESGFALFLSSGSLKAITGSDTVTSSFLPITSSQWLSQSLATNVANTSATAYANVFTLTGLTTGQRYVANLYIIGSSAATTTGFRMRVVTGSAYRGTLYTPTSTTAPAIQNSIDGADITSITAGTWPTANVKYIIFGDYTFIKGAQDPQVQIISEVAGSAITAFSGSVIFYRAIN